MTALSDEELAAHLKITPEQAAKLPVHKRKAYERLIKIGDDLDRWLDGKGPKPPGVLVLFDREGRDDD